MTDRLPYQLLATVVLIAHWAVVLFVVAGLALIVVGNLRRWRWVNHFWFRAAHLGTIGFIILEAWFGIACPLTYLEMRLLAKAGVETYSGGFIQYWLQRLLYYDAPGWVFVVGYSLFGLLVLAVWRRFPPQRSRRPAEPSCPDRFGDPPTRGDSRGPDEARAASRIKRPPREADAPPRRASRQPSTTN